MTSDPVGSIGPALDMTPDYAAAKRATESPLAGTAEWITLARMEAGLGRVDRARDAAARADALAPSSEGALLLARLDIETGEHRAALARLAELNRARPGNSQVLTWLGVSHGAVGESKAAEDALRQSIALNPRDPDALANLALLLLSSGERNEALALLKRSYEVAPAHVGTWEALTRSRLLVGDLAGAEYCLNTLQKLQPDLPAESCFLLAGVMQETKRYEEARRLYERAIAKLPGKFNYRSNYADMLLAVGDLEAGLAQHAALQAHHPARLRSHLAMRLALPGVYVSTDAVESARARFSAGLDALNDQVGDFLPQPADELEADVRWSNFYLAYQGGDDRDLQQRFSRFQSALVGKLIPPGELSRRPRDRIRIGFASAFFHNCTAGWYFSSWISDLPRTEFEVFIYSIGAGRDDLTERLARDATLRPAHHLRLPDLARTITDDQLDVLVFPELGMCPITFALASARLAPLQAAGWGHPVTSGHASIDVYFSCESMEPADAEAHYSERLVLLPGLGTRYSPQMAGSVRTRAELGLPENRPLALVSQSLFKIHPDNDQMYLELAGQVENLLLLFYEDSFARHTQLLRSRLAAQRLVEGRDFILLPRHSRAEFLALNAAADIMLDSLHWSGGNTSLDAISAGLPIVTLPGRFMRGRQSAGMLSAMQCEGLVAVSRDEYLDTASLLLTDRDARRHWHERITAGRPALFENRAPTAALANQLRKLVAERTN